MINLQAYLHFEMFGLYKACTLHDVNLSKTAELVGPPKLLLPPIHYWTQGGLPALIFAVLTGRSQELELMLRLRIEQGRSQRALVASATLTV